MTMGGRVKSIREKAAKLVSENEKVAALIEEVKLKLKNLTLDETARANFTSSIGQLMRMIKAHYSGVYKAFSTKTILLMVFGLLYFVTPTDLIPDFLPAIGLVDDITLIYYIIKSISQDIEAFDQWESGELEKAK